VSLVTAFAAAALLSLGLVGPAHAQSGHIRYAGAARSLKSNYIVVFKAGAVGKTQVQATTDRLAVKHHASVQRRYTNALHGFSAKMSETEATRIAADPTVAYVEQDRTVSLTATEAPTPSWGVDRIDQRNLPLNNSYSYSNNGSGVTAYIIDTGIRTSHTDFGGRAVWGTNTTGDGTDTDCNGHGTHVAGTVGGTKYGVAKGVTLVAVKVLDCSGSGSFSGVVAGIDWVTAQHAAGQLAVANMSLGAQGTDSATEDAVRTSIGDGVVYAIASGNSSANACNYTPARVTEAITVNATTSTDARASFSNYGSCTDIFAPGQSITSDWNTSNSATNTISGTSMATPHVTGAAALVLAANPVASPATVAVTLSQNATAGKVTNAGSGSPNRLLFVSR